MQRISVIAEIFGYLVCLLAVVVFFISIAGIVNGAFGVVNPTAGPRVIAARALPGGPMMREPGPGGNFFYRAPGAPGAQQGPLPMPSGAPDITTMRANMAGNARYYAAQRLVLAIVMLVVSCVVFRRTFAWLNPRHASGGGS